MTNRFLRAQSLLGQQNMALLSKKRVAIFGLGGVGGYAAEGLARSGIAHFLLVDGDDICLSNFNRQIIATSGNEGVNKALAMAKRILSINPEAEIDARPCFFSESTEKDFAWEGYDYIIDCVDDIPAKIRLAEIAAQNGISLISAMGAGNKISPCLLQVADIYETAVDPLARVLRRELKKRGIPKLKVVYSREKPLPVEREGLEEEGGTSIKKFVPGSLVFVPASMGLLLAAEVIKDLTGIRNDEPGC